MVIVFALYVNGNPHNGEKRRKTEDFSVNNGPRWEKKLKLLSFSTRWVGLSQETISRYCPIKPIDCSVVSTWSLHDSIWASTTPKFWLWCGSAYAGVDYIPQLLTINLAPDVDSHPPSQNDADPHPQHCPEQEYSRRYRGVLERDFSKRRVPQCLSLRRNWVPLAPTPSPTSECCWKSHSLAGYGLGDPISTKEQKFWSSYMYYYNPSTGSND